MIASVDCDIAMTKSKMRRPKARYESHPAPSVPPARFSHFMAGSFRFSFRCARKGSERSEFQCRQPSALGVPSEASWSHVFAYASAARRACFSCATLASQDEVTSR